MKLRTILVDDEELARQRLGRLLAPYPEVEIVGEAEDGEEAIELVATCSPDLLFLDIQMPGCSGLDVAASLSDSKPRVIFCTAFDQYAVDAFELRAIDYLLKPVSRARLKATMERVLSARRPPESKIQNNELYPERFLGKRANRFSVIPQNAVLSFVSEDGLTKLCARDAEYWMQPTLTELEQRLDPERFFRISRSTIVRLGAVAEVAPLVGGHGQATLIDGTQLDVSRRRFKEFIERLGG